MSQDLAVRARDLVFAEIPKAVAVAFIREHHSRLPKVQAGPWQFAFGAFSPDGTLLAAALWNNPSARTLPGHWLELRRLACSDRAPKNTASRFLAWMYGFFSAHHRGREKLISYQDTEVHTGGIYKAAGWHVDFITKARVRDRSKNRRGTHRLYRSDLNGVPASSAEKIRWCKELPPVRRKPLLSGLI